MRCYCELKVRKVKCIEKRHPREPKAAQYEEIQYGPSGYLIGMTNSNCALSVFSRLLALDIINSHLYRLLTAEAAKNAKIYMADTYKINVYICFTDDLMDGICLYSFPIFLI